MAEADSEAGLAVAAERRWSLLRYGRFLPGGEGPPGSGPTWKVFDASEESGPLMLTIVMSGHLFISRGQTLLEGFSLMGSTRWLRVVQRGDCLLFGSTVKDRSRMFRVQFSAEPGAQALGHCSNCVQTLRQFTPVQGGPGGGCALSTPLPPKALLASEALPLPCEQSAWEAGELGPFLRLCLLDQNFPAFVEDVERELKQMVGLGGQLPPEGGAQE